MKENCRQVFDQLNELKCHKAEGQEHWQSWTEQINRPELSDKLNIQYPYVYWSAEYGCPGLGANGGLGMLSRDHFLQARDLGFPGMFLGLAYDARKEQKICQDDQSHCFQYDQEEKLPLPQELGMDHVTQVNLKDSYNNNQNIDVFNYSLSTDQTKLLLLRVSGEVYPSSPDSDQRLWNNVVLGMGGYQVTKQLQEQGLIKEPSAFHLNESATVLGALAVLDDLTQKYGNNYNAYQNALSQLRNKTILTNHTLVPAAEASFNRGQCNLIFNNLNSTEVKIQLENFISQRGGELKFLDLSLYLAGTFNGVSKFHSKEATRIFKEPYGEYYYHNKIQFESVTNGIYEKGWNSRMSEFLESHQIINKFGILNKGFEEKIDQITTNELCDLKTEAVNNLRQFLLNNNRRLDQFGNAVNLPADAIVVGDARRFASYKRRWMMFKYPDRLNNLLTKNPNVHIFISGKAHPHDNVAKEHLSFVLDSIKNNETFRNQIHYLPDWDTELAKIIGPACHTWLNTPEVGKEACATSGMKTGFGGALQVSTHDGFYAELPKESYYTINGDTNSEQEFDSYYSRFENAINDSQNPSIYVDQVKKMWKGGLLDIVSGSRMIEGYINLAFPKNQKSFRTDLESISA